ncbi:MAG: Spx/MgsR family RNA polymerase-binding regulatory protein [Anaeroplasmataceae bacterium]
MITIYTTNSCSSCKKAVEWFKANHIKFTEKNMFKVPIAKDDIIKMLEHTENGFDDIISTRSKIILNNNIDIESMKFNELVDFIIKNPSILKRPIIVDERMFQAGYDDDEISAFRPRELRKMLECKHCEKIEDCDYNTQLVENLSVQKGEL